MLFLCLIFTTASVFGKIFRKFINRQKKNFILEDSGKKLFPKVLSPVHICTWHICHDDKVLRGFCGSGTQAVVILMKNAGYFLIT